MVKNNLMKKITLFIIISCSIGLAHAQKFEGLALTPPMGWNSWNTFAVNINEKLVEEMADHIVSSGMKDAGYNYVILDDAWMAVNRDSSGNLTVDPKRFPHGIKAVADYIHSKGLKFGLYNCAGTKTCAGYPGTRGYEYQDARFYASVGIDYLKYDWCNSDGINAKEAYTTMSNAIKAARRPIVFSLCEWGTSKPWEWATSVGHLWRTTTDITNQFEGIKSNGSWSSFSIMKILDSQTGLRIYAGPSHWNDPDMLEVGNGMTAREDKAHFSMWCMIAAPLIAGNDLRKMTPQSLNILTNKEVIAIDQDSLGIEGYNYLKKDSLEIWVKPLKNNEVAICFLNRASKDQLIDFNWTSNRFIDGFSKMDIDFNKILYNIRDLWQKKSAGTTAKPFKEVVHAHDVVMIKLCKR